MPPLSGAGGGMPPAGSVWTSQSRSARSPTAGTTAGTPDISPVVHVQPGDEVVFDTLDAVDAQLDLERGAEQLAGPGGARRWPWPIRGRHRSRRPGRAPARVRTP